MIPNCSVHVGCLYCFLEMNVGVLFQSPLKKRPRLKVQISGLTQRCSPYWPFTLRMKSRENLACCGAMRRSTRRSLSAWPNWVSTIPRSIAGTK